MDLLAIPENNTTFNIYNPDEIRKGSLNNKLVFMQKANADVTKSGKQTIITINCRCFECIGNCVQGSTSGGRAFESFSDYYTHLCTVMKKDIEIFKCPCKGCPWSIVRSFGAMIKHLRLQHTDLHEEFSTLCDGDFTKLWISVNNDEWTAVLKFKKVVVAEPIPIKEEQIDWENAPVLGTAKEIQSTWTKPLQIKTPEPVISSVDEFPQLVENSMKQIFFGPLDKPVNVFNNGIEYYPARAPWDIKLDDKNKMFIGIMKKGTTFYVGMCPNERPLTFDEKRSPENNHYCLDKNCLFDHMAGWSESHIETINIEPAQEMSNIDLIEENEPELEQIFSELTELKLEETDIHGNQRLMNTDIPQGNNQHLLHDDIHGIQETPKKTRKRKNNKEDPSAFEDN